LTNRLVITGGTGFIGRQCLPLLAARGYEIHAVTTGAPGTAHHSRSAGTECADVQWHQADLLDAPKTAALMADLRPTHLLHFAWYTEPGKYLNSLENFRWVEASLNLLLAFGRHGGRRAVLAGSSFEYEGDHGACCETGTPLKPKNAYGACKAALQGLQAAFAEQAGLSAAWGRIFYLYGPYENPKRLVASVIRSLLRGEPALCSPGEQVRDFLYVEDVADAFVALMESDVRGPVNIASGQPITVKGIVQAIAERLGRREMVRLGALPARATEPHFLVADVGRLKNEVRWQPKYDLDRGLGQTIGWWRNQLSKET
jgi:nucleoside-diphosphate-sugar epimerase